MFSTQSYEKVHRKKYKLAFVVCLILYAILNLIFCSLAQNSLKYDTVLLQDISKNWQTKAISNIRVDSACPKGYEEFVGYTWPGTSEGCWCGDLPTRTKNQYDLEDDLSEGSCNSRQEKAGCKEINAVPAKNLSIWGDVASSSPKKICIERSRDAWADVALDSGEKCSDSRMKKCGKSPNNVFCTQETQCPINDIRVVNVDLVKNPTALASCLTDNYCLVLSQSWLSIKILQYKRADAHDALPIAQLKMNEYGMCADSSQDNITPDREEFPLLKTERENCEVEKSKTWNLTDSVTEEDLFDANGLSSSMKYLSKYRYYPEPESGDDYKWGFYARSFIPWNINCRDKMGDFIDYSENIEILNIYQALLMGSAYITSWTLGIVLPFYLLLQVFQGDKTVLWVKPPRTKEEKRQSKEFARNWNYLFMFMALPFTLLALLASSKANRFFQGIIEENCSSSQALRLIYDLSKSLDDVYEDNIICLFLLIGIICVSLGFYGYKNWKRTQKGGMNRAGGGEESNLGGRLLEMKEVEHNNVNFPESLDEEEKRSNEVGRHHETGEEAKPHFYPVTGIMSIPYHYQNTSGERVEGAVEKGTELHEYHHQQPIKNDENR